MSFCANCGASLSDDDLFCGKCGKPVRKSSSSGNDTSYSLTISRAKQFICALCSYEVFVNGESVGRIPVGKTITVRVFSEEVRVEIKCVTLMMTRFKLNMKLKLKQNARIDFHLKYPGSIEAAVTGAEVLERRA